MAGLEDDDALISEVIEAIGYSICSGFIKEMQQLVANPKVVTLLKSIEQNKLSELSVKAKYIMDQLGIM